MQRSYSAALFGLLAALPLSAVERGDSFDSVIAEKGPPSGKMNLGRIQILKYSDQEIKLEDGKVVSIRVPAAIPSPAPAPSRAPAAATPRPSKSGESAHAPALWTESYNEAIAIAKEQNRQVFMFFTGSDWCGWCKRLEAEVLSTSVFSRYAAARLVLLKVDFPRRTPQPAELAAQNAALAKRYRIDGYPTVVVLSSEGKRLAALGYEPGGPDPFVGTLSLLK